VVIAGEIEKQFNFLFNVTSWIMHHRQNCLLKISFEEYAVIFQIISGTHINVPFTSVHLPEQLNPSPIYPVSPGNIVP